MINFFLSGFLLLVTSTSFAASCCGGGFAFPALILGDDKAQVTTSLSHGQVTDDVLPNGKWMRRKDQNQSETFKIEGATLISDSLQAGFSIPVIYRKVEAESSTGLGDISTGLGYEFLPELGYSKWKPKGWGFLQLTLPTSPSIYDASNNFATDSRGRGFFTAGSGLVFTKTFNAWDAHASAELHKSFARQFTSASAGGDIEAIPGWGHSATLGFGWSKGALRLGNSLSMLNEDAIEIKGAQTSTGYLQKNMTWSFVANYMLSMESTLTASYSDQTLFGSPENSSLSKTVTLSYQQRWQR
ncbi:serine protease spb1 [Bdellovibrio svalbardensis]|uniref:Serine protease spb1 n=1 Tax=Bdellovibrio svalbardensis TaxID=2972972 RepID=A0ABT6DHH0_9BACT|nr:serine protease spb1 [Bdellovibrio svalbardensis]MDG0816307.1 serine protease spb1 [Bdellovibrio svalbardensis]